MKENTQNQNLNNCFLTIFAAVFDKTDATYFSSSIIYLHYQEHVTLYVKWINKIIKGQIKTYPLIFALVENIDVK